MLFQSTSKIILILHFVVEAHQDYYNHIRNYRVPVRHPLGEWMRVRILEGVVA